MSAVTVGPDLGTDFKAVVYHLESLRDTAMTRGIEITTWDEGYFSKGL